MANYTELRGLKVKYLDSDPSPGTEGAVWYNTAGELKAFIATGAWHSSAPMATARVGGRGAGGTQSAAWMAGGLKPSAADETEEYNGTGWATGGDLNTARSYANGDGPQTAAFFVGGDDTIASNELYDGSSWTESGDLNTGRSLLGACGTSTAGLAFAGNPSHKTNSEEFNGSSWSEGDDINTGRNGMGACGIQTAGLIISGAIPGGTTANSEEYNGTSWTEGNNVNVARSGLSASGIQTSAILYCGGTSPTPARTHTETYDGTSWTTSPASVGNARWNAFGAGATSNSALVAGGEPGYQSITEEFTLSFLTTTSAAWASGGNLNTSRQRAGGFGNAQTSAVVAAGATAPPASALDKTEEYNGTSWTEVNDCNTARFNMTAFGTEAAGVLAGVGTPSVSYGGTAEEYDGTNWTTVNPYNAPGANYRSSCGPQTAGLLAGGVSPHPAEHTNAVEEYDGTNWTSGTNLPQFQAYQNQAGTQTAAINGGANAGPNATTVNANTVSLEYDG